MDIVTEEVREEQSAEIGDDEPMYDGETKQSILNTSDTTGSKKALSITENSDARMDDAISEAESDDDIEDPLDNAAPNQQDDEDEEEYALHVLPLSRIKTMMRRDPEVTMVGQDAVFAVTKATELFVQYLAVKTYEVTSKTKRKTIQKRDISTVNAVLQLFVYMMGSICTTQ
eukprot:m.543989 g.543989  ORF g.543989 m.543989 type:complete len:172 (+) comp22134_c0_seq2:131-646(+)